MTRQETLTKLVEWWVADFGCAAEGDEFPSTEAQRQILESITGETAEAVAAEAVVAVSSYREPRQWLSKPEEVADLVQFIVEERESDWLSEREPKNEEKR